MLDFLQWDAQKQLKLTPKFQRRSVWPDKAKSYLIDTIVREKTIPPIFIRLNFDTQTRRTLREVVDGQQRIRTVLEFLRGEFRILKVHNEDLKDMYYEDLPEDMKQRVLQYGFTVYLLQNVSDEDVLDIFARFNTYSVPLNAQELRNANFTGLFKQTVYTLAHRYNRFWKENRLFSDRQIARMNEVELVSELLVTVLEGFQSTGNRELAKIYTKYDDEFEARDRTMRRFETVIDIIGAMFGDSLSDSDFRRKPLFFSLFVAIYSCRYGIPGKQDLRIKFSPTQISLVHGRLARFETQLEKDEVPAKYAEFVEAMKRATANQGNREARHRTLVDLMSAAIS